jgi:PncC family amidohydrolase
MARRARTGKEIAMDADTLARMSGEVLKQRQLTLAVAESCTGGLLATHITNVPGSSAYFKGAVVAYFDEAKRQVLGVPADVLAQHGAVSFETARAMASGVRSLLSSDLALAITGFAGPGGGSAQKPVGLVYVALAGADTQECHDFLWDGDRWENRERSARTALELLLEHLSASPAKLERPSPQSGLPVSVDARFDEQGRLTPRAFQWRGHWVQVASIGRVWGVSRAGVFVQHYLVSTPGESLFDIAYEPLSARWHAKPSGRRPLVA